VFKALTSTCSITKFAKIALTGEPIGQPEICVESAIDDEIIVIKYKFKQIHDVVNRHVCSFRDGRISFKSVFSHVECQSCRYRCEKEYNIERFFFLLIMQKKKKTHNNLHFFYSTTKTKKKKKK